MGFDTVHSRAICEEIGFRLRQALKNAHAESAPHLSELVKRMRLQEVKGAPSIAPFSDASGENAGRERSSMSPRRRLF